MAIYLATQAWLGTMVIKLQRMDLYRSSNRPSTKRIKEALALAKTDQETKLVTRTFWLYRAGLFLIIIISGMMARMVWQFATAQ